MRVREKEGERVAAQQRGGVYRRVSGAWRVRCRLPRPPRWATTAPAGRHFSHADWPSSSRSARAPPMIASGHSRFQARRGEDVAKSCLSHLRGSAKR